MTTNFMCVRCGYPEKSHDRGLINEPQTPEWEWIERVKPGYSLCILDCLETKLPEEYLARKEELFWQDQTWGDAGYQSRDPEAEARAYERRAVPGGAHSFILIPGRKPITIE